MDSESTLGMHFKYYKALMAIGKRNIIDSVTVDMLEISRSDVQSCYRDMKNTGFKGSIFDFLSTISMGFIQSNWFLAADILLKRAGNPLVAFSNEKSKLNFYMMELAETCLRFPEDTKNMLRMVNHNPYKFFESDQYGEFRAKFQKFDERKLEFALYKILSIIYFSYCSGYECLSFIEEAKME